MPATGPDRRHRPPPPPVAGLLTWPWLAGFPSISCRFSRRAGGCRRSWHRAAGCSCVSHGDWMGCCSPRQCCQAGDTVARALSTSRQSGVLSLFGSTARVLRNYWVPQLANPDRVRNLRSSFEVVQPQNRRTLRQSLGAHRDTHSLFHVRGNGEKQPHGASPPNRRSTAISALTGHPVSLSPLCAGGAPSEPAAEPAAQLGPPSGSSMPGPSCGLGSAPALDHHPGRHGPTDSFVGVASDRDDAAAAAAARASDPICTGCGRERESMIRFVAFRLSSSPNEIAYLAHVYANGVIRHTAARQP